MFILLVIKTLQYYARYTQRQIISFFTLQNFQPWNVYLFLMSTRENSCLDQLLCFTSAMRGHGTLSIGSLGSLDRSSSCLLRNDRRKLATSGLRRYRNSRLAVKRKAFSDDIVLTSSVTGQHIICRTRRYVITDDVGRGRKRKWFGCLFTVRRGKGRERT